jgi:hypothetical protein
MVVKTHIEDFEFRTALTVRKNTAAGGLNGLSFHSSVVSKLTVSKVAVCCFSWGICYDFYRVKTAEGG